MREFTKSIFSYTWSSSLFGLQQMVNLVTPQGERRTQQVTESFEKITKATAGEMGDVVRGTFKVGDDLQRKSVDVMFEVFTLGIFDRGKGRGNNSQTSSSSTAAGTVSNMGEQAVSAIAQGLQVLGQTAGVVAQSMGGFVPGQGCAGSRSEPTGWGPVPTTPRSGG